jgi:hypothetical protein
MPLPPEQLVDAIGEADVPLNPAVQTDAATLFANAVSSAGAGSGTFNWSAILAALPEVNV